MSVAFLTSLTETDFKDFLKQAIKEVLAEQSMNTQSNVPEILDIKQAADFLKLKVTTLYEKTSQKEVPHFKKGNRLYFNKLDLTEWLNSGRIKTKKEIEGQAIDYLMPRKPKKGR